jgi:hypothetical protein
MMGKIAKSGKSFKGCVQYCMLKDKASLLYADGVRTGEVKHTIADFNMQRKLNPNLGQAVGHIALNWSPEDMDKLSDEKMIELAQAYLLKMKIRETQVLMVRHHDAKHPHLHIIYNRVNHQGKTISDSFQRELNVKVSKALTLQHGFHMGLGKEQVNRPQLKGADKVKYELYDAIKAAIPKVRSVDELKELLLKQDIGIQYKYRSGTNEVQGISFAKDGYTFKGSKIDRSLSYGKISEAISRQVSREAELQAVPSLADQLREKLTRVGGEGTVTEHVPAHHGKSLLSTLLEAQHIAGPGHDQDDSIFRRKKRKKQGASQDQSQGVSR